MEENLEQPKNAQETTLPVQKKLNQHLPPGKTIILIIALVLATIGLVYLAVSSSTVKEEKQQTSVTKDSLVYAQTEIRFADTPYETTNEVTFAKEYNLDANVTTGNNKITAVQFELTYDPKALTNVDIKLGNLNKEWTELIKKIDPVNGTITYAVGIALGQRGISGTGSIATLTFNKVYGFKGETKIRFQPKAQTTAEGISKSVLRKTVNAAFSFPEGTTQ